MGLLTGIYSEGFVFDAGVLTVRVQNVIPSLCVYSLIRITRDESLAEQQKERLSKLGIPGLQ